MAMRIYTLNNSRKFLVIISSNFGYLFSLLTVEFLMDIHWTYFFNFIISFYIA